MRWRAREPTSACQRERLTSNRSLPENAVHGNGGSAQKADKFLGCVNAPQIWRTTNPVALIVATTMSRRAVPKVASERTQFRLLHAT